MPQSSNPNPNTRNSSSGIPVRIRPTGRSYSQVAATGTGSGSGNTTPTTRSGVRNVPSVRKPSDHHQATGLQTASDTPPQATVPLTASDAPSQATASGAPTQTYLSALYSKNLIPPPPDYQAAFQPTLDAISSTSSGASKSGTSMSGSLPSANTTMDSVSDSKLESSESSDSQKKDINEEVISVFMEFLGTLNKAALQDRESRVLGHLCHKLEQSFRKHIGALATQKDNTGKNVVGDVGASNLSNEDLEMIDGSKLFAFQQDQKLIGRYGRVVVENTAAVLQTHKTEKMWAAQKAMSTAIQRLQTENNTIRSSMYESEALTRDEIEAKFNTLLHLHLQSAAMLNLAIAAIDGSLTAKAAVCMRRLFEDARTIVYVSLEALFPGSEALLCLTQAPFDVSAQGQLKTESIVRVLKQLYHDYNNPSSPRFLFDDLVEGEVNKTVAQLAFTRADIQFKRAGTLREVFLFLLPRVELVQLFYHYLFVALDDLVRRFEQRLKNATPAEDPQTQVEDPQTSVIAEHLEKLESLRKVSNVPKVAFLFKRRFKDMISENYNGPLHIPFRNVVYTPPSKSTGSKSTGSKSTGSDLKLPVPFADSHDPKYLEGEVIDVDEKPMNALPYARNVPNSTEVTVKVVDDALQNWDKTFSAKARELLEKAEQAKALNYCRSLFPEVDDANTRKLSKLRRRRLHARENANALRYLIELIDKDLLDDVLNETPLRVLLNQHSHERIDRTGKVDVELLIKDSPRLLGVDWGEGEQERVIQLNDLLGETLPYGHEYHSNTEVKFPTSLAQLSATQEGIGKPKEPKHGTSSGQTVTTLNIRVLKTGLEELKHCVNTCM